MTWETILQQTISGLSSGMVLFLVALGLTLVLGTLKVLNLAHGSIYVIGLYLCFAITAQLVNIPGNFYIALILVPIGAALFGGLVEVAVLRPVYGLPHHIYQLIVGFGVIYIVMDLLKLVWGGSYHTIAAPAYLMGQLNFLGVIMPQYNLLLILVGFVFFVLMYLFINKTRAGLIIRGVTTDRMMMSALGQNVPRVYTLVFMLGCGIAGLAGALIGPITVAGPGMEMMVLIKAFIVIVVGGFGSIGGALVAAILVGLVDAFGILIIPGLALGFPFFLMLIVLIFRPWGLFGKPLVF